ARNVAGEFEGLLLSADQRRDQVDFGAFWNGREEGAAVQGPIDRDRDAAVENRPQLRITFVQPCQKVTDGRGLNLELRRASRLRHERAAKLYAQHPASLFCFLISSSPYCSWPVALPSRPCPSSAPE